MRTLFTIFFVCLSLLGCQLKIPVLIDDEPKLPTHVEGTSDTEIIKLYRKLTAEQVQIITMGDAYMISIPSTLLFANESPKINWKSYALLNDVVCYLRSFRKIAVQVNAYATCFQSKARTRVLTLARAKAVGDYLWSQNIEARIVFTEGLGDDKPIVEDLKCTDASPNSRIEIIFKQVVA